MTTWILIIFLSIVIATGIGFMIVHFRFKNDESYSGAPVVRRHNLGEQRRR